MLHFALFLLAPALVFGAPATTGKGPTPYKYPYELRDTTKHKSPFFMFGSLTGNFTDGRNLQLRPIGNGEYIPVVDKTSPVLQSQLSEGELQAVTYFPASKTKPTGLTAGLRLVEQDKKTQYTAYEVIFSKKEPKMEAGFHGFGLFDPEGTDGIYTVSADVGHKADTFLFAFCERENGEYYQLEYAQSTSHKLVTAPKGCYESFLFATLAPPYGKPKKE